MNVPVIDVGGTHVTAALVDTALRRTVAGTRRRRPLNSGGTAGEIIATLAAAIGSLDAAGAPALGVAMPGPTGRFRDVGKFDALDGVDVRSALRAALPSAPARIAFVNDAAAFTVGEWVGGAARGAERVAGLTLGTGVGSAFLDGGRVVSDGPDVPPHGYAHLLRVNGRPLEELVSRRAIITAYQSATRPAGSPPVTPGPGADVDVDVDTIACLAASGDATARAVIDLAIGTLGRALRPWLARFRAEILVVGGGIARSWELVRPALDDALRGPDPSAPAWRDGLIIRASDPEESALLGAAWTAADRQRPAAPS